MSLDTTTHPPPEPSAVARDARVQRYLDHVQFEKRLAKRTLILYGLDLTRLEALARAVPVDVAQAHQGEPFAQGVSEDVKLFAESLGQPYCGINNGFEAAQWLANPDAAQSLALVTLREPQTGDAPAKAMGLLVLASPDSQRYHAGMGTEFLDSLSALASAALQRLR